MQRDDGCYIPRCCVPNSLNGYETSFSFESASPCSTKPSPAVEGDRRHDGVQRYGTNVRVLLGRRIGDVGGKRKVDGRRMDRNSSRASEGRVDLRRPKSVSATI